MGQATFSPHQLRLPRYSRHHYRIYTQVTLLRMYSYISHNFQDEDLHILEPLSVRIPVGAELLPSSVPWPAIASFSAMR